MPKPLAEIVIDEDLATRKTVASAAKVADRKRIPLVVALVREFDLDEVALVGAIRRQTRVAQTDPDSASFDPEAIRLISHDACRRLRVMPVEITHLASASGGRILHVAMADPTDQVVLAEVAHHAGCEVEGSLMTLSAVEELVEKSYKRFVTQVMKRGNRSFAGGGARNTAQPTTQPFHRVTDQAELAQRHGALIKLLIDKNVITEDEYEEEVRLMMKRRDEGP